MGLNVICGFWERGVRMLVTFKVEIKETKNLQNDDGRWEIRNKQLWKNGIRFHGGDSQ
jgi:glutaredoxin-related protein